MSAASPAWDPQGVPGYVSWTVPGTKNGSTGYWELVIDTNTVVHFLYMSK
ncbi:hypothetical protein ACGF0D_44085 [Kitasatospora sp. NPDC048298]